MAARRIVRRAGRTMPRAGGGQPARHAADPQYQPGGSAPDPLGRDSPTGPPWEQPGWDDTGSSLPGPDPAGLAGKHPSDPLPSLPPPPLPEGDWAEAPQAFEYAGETGHHPGYHGTGYPDDAGDTDGGYAGDRPDDTGYGYEGYDGTGYDPGSYPEAGYAAGYDDTGTGFPVTNGGFPAVTGDFTDTGTGYAVPAYADGRFTDGAAATPTMVTTRPGMSTCRMASPPPARTTAAILTARAGMRTPACTAAGRRATTAVSCPAWAAAPRTATDARPGEGRTDGRGGRRGSTGPGKQSTGRSGSGRSGTGRSGTGKSGTSGGGKRKSGIRRWAPWLALSVVVALLIGAGAGYFYVYRTYLHPPDFAGPGHDHARRAHLPGRHRHRGGPAPAAGRRGRQRPCVLQRGQGQRPGHGPGTRLLPGAPAHERGAGFRAAAQAVVAGADEGHHPGGLAAVPDHRGPGPRHRQPAGLPAGHQECPPR